MRSYIAPIQLFVRYRSFMGRLLAACLRGRVGGYPGRPSALVRVCALHKAMVTFHASLDDEWGAIDYSLPADRLKARPALRDRARG